MPRLLELMLLIAFSAQLSAFSTQSPLIAHLRSTKSGMHCSPPPKKHRHSRSLECWHGNNQAQKPDDTTEEESADSMLCLGRRAALQTLWGVPLFFGAAPAFSKEPSVSWPGFAAAPKFGDAPPPGSSGSEAVSQPELRGQGLTTPKAEEMVRSGVRDLLSQDRTIAGGLLRLAFHDATTRDTVKGQGGANGSIRLELNRRSNYGLGRAVAALTPIQATSGLSWADTIAVAGAEVVTSSGGPRIKVELGRLDVNIPDPERLSKPVGQCREATIQGGGTDCRGQASETIPGAGLDSDGLRNYFFRLGFDEEEMVALMGGHTLGRWTSLLGVPKECLKDLNSKWAQCLPYGKKLPFVSEDPDKFSNTYYKWLLLWNKREINNGDVHFIPSDVVLVIDEDLKKQVEKFASDEAEFFKAYTRAYTKLVSLGFSSSV